MTVMGLLALIGAVALAWCSYLDVQDLKRERRARRLAKQSEEIDS